MTSIAIVKDALSNIDFISANLIKRDAQVNIISNLKELENTDM